MSLLTRNPDDLTPRQRRIGLLLFVVLIAAWIALVGIAGN